MLGPFARVPGAVVDESGLRHLGNPLGEQRALAAGAAVAPLGDRAVLAVAGEDRLSWLDSLTSQALTRLAPGESTELLVLDPHGHVEHAASVVDDGETTWLIADRGGCRRAAVVAAQDAVPAARRPAGRERRVRRHRRHARGARGRRARPRPPACPSCGPTRGRTSRPAATPTRTSSRTPARERDWAEAIVTARRGGAHRGCRSRGRSRLAGLAAADALRIAAWRPRWANEVDDRALPHELDWLRTAVHLEKGCYRGQETVAKVHNLGHPPRRIVALQLDGSDSVLPGSRRRGLRRRRTSWAPSPRLRCTSRRARSRSRSCAAARPSTRELVVRTVGRRRSSPRRRSSSLPRPGPRRTSRACRGSAAERAEGVARGRHSRQPTTTAIATGWRARFDPRRRLARVRHSVDRDPADRRRRRPAPTRSRTTCWGIPRRCWPRRSASRASGSCATPDRVACSRRSLGMLVGILVAELLLLVAGLGLVAARARARRSRSSSRGFLSAQASFAIAAAIQALIVMVIPANAPFLRLVDGVVGRRRGAAGDRADPADRCSGRRPRRRGGLSRRSIRPMAHPRAGAAPRRPAARRARAREGASAAAARRRVVDVAGLRDSPSPASRRSCAASAPSCSGTSASASPPTSRPATCGSSRGGSCTSATTACRAPGRSRPARRPRPRQPSWSRSRSTDISLEPVAREAVRAVAGRLDPALLLPDASLGDQNLIAALRPFAVDLLTATGMSSAEARACVPRI